VIPSPQGSLPSLARPEGNITGLSLIAPEVSGKRLELLREVMPKLARVIVLSNPNNRAVVLALQETQAAAQILGLKLDSLDIREPSELDRALSLVAGGRPDALVLLSDSMILSRSAEIATFAVKQRLPSISPFREFAELGGLMSYGPNLPDIYRRGVGYISKILRGASPAELPIEQPTKFELVINLKTARALGLTVTRDFLLIADEVIE
jgi:putative ABC transport system substrate-binding protein